MGVAVQYPHLKRDPQKGMVIKGHRYTVLHLAIEHIEHGWSADTLHENHPGLPLGAIHSALAYYYDHEAEMNAEMERRVREDEKDRKKSRPLTREQFLRRLKK